MTLEVSDPISSNECTPSLVYFLSAFGFSLKIILDGALSTNGSWSCCAPNSLQLRQSSKNSLCQLQPCFLSLIVVRMLLNTASDPAREGPSSSWFGEESFYFYASITSFIDLKVF